jgi:hypothetical protein
MSILRYTLLRLFVFAVVGALLWLTGMRGLVLLLTAVFVSGLVSIFVLRRSRDDLSVALDRRISTIRERIGSRAATEDAWDEARRTGSAQREANREQYSEEQTGHAGGAEDRNEVRTALTAENRQRGPSGNRDGEQG